MSDEVAPDLQPTTTKRHSKNKLLLFLGVALILIIGIAITPTLLRKIEKNRDVKCKDNLKQLYCALKQYSMDYADRFPNGNGMEGLSKLQGEYLKDYSSCFCPSAKTKTVHGKLTDKDISYVYFGGFVDSSGDHWPQYSDYPLIFDRPGNHKDHINYVTMYRPKTLKTKAKTCAEFIEEVDGAFKSDPVLLKIMREKAAEADRRYSQEK